MVQLLPLRDFWFVSAYHGLQTKDLNKDDWDRYRVEYILLPLTGKCNKPNLYRTCKTVAEAYSI